MLDMDDKFHKQILQELSKKTEFKNKFDAVRDGSEKTIFIGRREVAAMIYSPFVSKTVEHVYDHFRGISRLRRNMMVLASIQCRY